MLSHRETLISPAPPSFVLKGSLLIVETFAVLRGAIAQLEPREQEVLRLRFIEDLTQRQIGDQIGVSQMQVSRLLTEILRQLKELIGEDGRAA